MTNKAPPQVVSIKDALKIIREFDGQVIPLSQFLEGCTETLAMVEDTAEPNLVKLIRSKLIGEARQSISGQTFDNLELLKDYLKAIYYPEKFGCSIVKGNRQ